MSEEAPVFLVDPESSPVAVKIVGRASFQNVVPLKDFLKDSYVMGRRCFVFDFSECTGMDSTVLGVIAGCALELRRLEPKGSLVLSRLSERNRALVHSLGLHRIAIVDEGGSGVDESSPKVGLSHAQLNEIESARLCLEAHEKLLEVDDQNRQKFQDVIAYLKSRVDEDEG